MLTFFSYTDLVQRDGKTYLFDSSHAERRMDTIAEMQKALREIFDTLHQFGYPASAPYCLAVISDGADGLKRCVRQTAEELVPAGAPPFWRQQQIKIALDGIPARLLEWADGIPAQLAHPNDGVPPSVPALTQEDMTFDPEKGFIVDMDAVRAKVEAACSVEVSADALQLAKAAKAFLKEARRLRAKGLDVPNLVKFHVGNPAQGDADLPEVELLRLCSVGRLPSDAEVRERMEASASFRANMHPDGIPVAITPER